MKLVYLASHPIQYHAPLFRALAAQADFEAWFAHRQDARGQGDAGYGVAFDWNVDLLGGYAHRQLENVARAPSVSRYAGCDTPSVRASLAAHRPDALVVGGWHLKAYRQALAVARALGIPVRVRTDSQWRPDESPARRLAKRLAYRWALPAPVGFLAAGVRSRDYLRDLGFADARIAVVPHAIDVERFASAPRAPRATDAATIGFVGRLLPHKRAIDLLDAVRELDGVRVTVIGDGPERAPLEAHARRHRLDATFAGFVNQAELPAALATLDVLALPSVDDTWGLVVNEALAAGAAAVVSDAVGCAADFADGVVVHAHAARSVAGLRDALRAALASRGRPDFESRRRARVASFAPPTVARALLAAFAGASR